jgi:hypothetical protein
MSDHARPVLAAPNRFVSIIAAQLFATGTNRQVEVSRRRKSDDVCEQRHLIPVWSPPVA